MLHLLLLSLLFLPVVASAAEDCSAEIALIDERVAGQPDDQKKQMVMLMRQGLEQMCALLDDAALAQYRESVISFYPDEADLPSEQANKPVRENRTLAEQLAEKAARAERRERDAAVQLERKTAELATKLVPLDSAVIDAPPSVTRAAGAHLARADRMNRLIVRDWDVHNGDLRVLYTTLPDRSQYGLPDWQFYIYVVTVSPDGTATQTLVTSKQANDHAALALRRGYDEVFLMRHVDRPGEPTFFERWSIPDRRRIASVDMTRFHPEINGVTYSSVQFGAPTSDGDLIFSAFSAGSRGQAARQAIFKLSMDGEVRSGSELPQSPDTLRPWTWFTTKNGGAGLVFDVSADSDAGLLSSDLANLEDPELPTSSVPTVILEKRFLLIDSNGKPAWESAALARMMAFQPRQLNSSDNPPGNPQTYLADQFRAMDIAATKYRAGRDINSLNVGFAVHAMIKPMGDGYAALVDQTANQDIRPPVHGQYLVKLNSKGVTQEIYLNPLALQMNVKFTAFVAGQGNGDFYLLATTAGGQVFVLHLNADGEPLAYAETASLKNFDLQSALLVSDSRGVWLFGERWQDNVGKPLLWVERFTFQ